MCLLLLLCLRVVCVRNKRHAQLFKLALHSVLEFLQLGPRFSPSLPHKIDELLIHLVVGAVLQHLGVDLREEANAPEEADEQEETENKVASGARKLVTVQALIRKL